MLKHKYSVWIFALLLLLPFDSYAPCVMFAPPEGFLSGTGQRAFITYNPQTQQVSLVPSINFNGDATDFGLVIPTPSVPKLETVNQQIFRELDLLTSPVIRRRGGGSSGCNLLTEGGVDFNDAAETGVGVISEQRIGAFDTVILTADDPTALTDWLDEHGYQHSIQDNTILQSYIDQKWIFTAMRLSGGQLQDGTPRSAPFFNATIDPILMTYTSASLVYPLRLTSISAREGADVTVYILTVNKMHFSGATVEYANEITDSERDVIGRNHPTFGSFIGEQRYLTRLRRTFARTEMDTDFELVRHENDQEFRRVQYLQMVYGLDYLLLGLVAICYFVWGRIHRLRSGN